MELDVLSIIVNLGGRNNCFILHMSPKYPKTCPTEVSHVPAVTQLEHCPWVSVHQVPSAGFPFPLKCVACSHKPKGKKQNGLLKPRLSFLLLEEKNTTAEFVNSATTRRETFHKTGFVCESVRQKGTGRITAERHQLLQPCKLILQALEKQLEQGHNYYNSLSAAQSS